MRKHFLFTLVALTISAFFLNAQDSVSFSPEQQEKILKRWIWYQPSVTVALKGGDTLVGQPIHFNMEEFLVYSSDSLPLGMEGHLSVIPVDEIERVWITRGGRITISQTAGIVLGIAGGAGLGLAIGGPVGALIGGNLLGVGGGFAGKAIYRSASNEEVCLNPGSLDYEKDLQKLRTWSVFEDSLIHTDDLEKLPEYSEAVRRAFPKKHLRITMGINCRLISSMEKSVKEVIKSSGLPDGYKSYGSPFGLEYLDFSWRLRPHWIVGGGFMRELGGLENYSYYSSYSETTVNTYSSYWVDLTDFRFYTEYVLNPVNRFFTTNSEFLFGAGLIISLPTTSYDYSEYDPLSADHWSVYLYEKHTIPGIQLRAAYHIYLSRNFSLSGGLEANLYQSLKLPGLEPPADYDGEYYGFRDHSLNYSSFRLKLGAHLYF